MLKKLTPSLFLPPPPPPPPTPPIPPPIPPPRFPENRVPPFRPRGPRLPPPGGLRSRGFSLLFSTGALAVSDFTFGVSVPAMIARARCSAFGRTARREKNLDFPTTKTFTLHRPAFFQRTTHYGVRRRKRLTRGVNAII